MRDRLNGKASAPGTNGAASKSAHLRGWRFIWVTSRYHTPPFPEPSCILMASYSTNQFKPGLKIMIDGDPYNIVENEMVKPGKGQAFNRVRVRNLLSGRVIERTFKSGDSVEGADIAEFEMQFLYSDGEAWHFMNPTTFEQIQASGAVVGDVGQWLKGQEMCSIMLFNGEPIGLTPPNFVVLKITQTDPGIRGDTATGGTKPATMETGAIVRVPLFIEEGSLLKIDTRTGEYVSRAKEE